MKYLLVVITVYLFSFQVNPLQHDTIKRQSKSPITFPPPVLPYDPMPVHINNISEHVGEWVIVTGKVYGYKHQNKHLFLFLGRPYPRQQLTIKVDDEIINDIKLWKNKTVKATGKVLCDNGTYELGVNHAAYISKLN